MQGDAGSIVRSHLSDLLTERTMDYSQRQFFQTTCRAALNGRLGTAIVSDLLFLYPSLCFGSPTPGGS